MIVGAGLSGYSAAAKLIENELNDVVVLEAEGRIGGRVHSVKHENGFIDLGAQWCHGEKNNAIFELVNKHFKFGRSKFLLNPINCVLSNGMTANQEECSELNELLSRIYDETDKAQNISVGAFVKQEYEKEILNNRDYQQMDSKLVKLMLASYAKEITGYYAADSWNDVSAYYNMFSQECEGNLALTWKKEGFKKVFEFLSVSKVCSKDSHQEKNFTEKTSRFIEEPQR